MFPAQRFELLHISHTTHSHPPEDERWRESADAKAADLHLAHQMKSTIFSALNYCEG